MEELLMPAIGVIQMVSYLAVHKDVSVDFVYIDDHNIEITIEIHIDVPERITFDRELAKRIEENERSTTEE